MKRSLIFGLLLSCGSAFAQTAATQSSTTPAAATDNAVKSSSIPPSQASGDAGSRLPTEGEKPVPGDMVADQPTMPTVRTFPDVRGENVDPRITPERLPNKRLTLIGGTVRQVDPIRNRMIVDIYGGKSMRLIFDDRTKISRNGAEVNPLVIRKGDRVYLDTQQVQDKLFAKQIQIVTKSEAADLSGQIVSFTPQTRSIEIRDPLSARPFTFVVDPNAAVSTKDGRAATMMDLRPGTLVTAHFNPGRGDQASIRDISIVAAPGAEFTIYGAVNHLDLRSGTLAVQNKADDKAYEVKFPPGKFQVDDLAMGSEVSVVARFDGQDYVAQSLNVTSMGKPSAVDSDQGESTDHQSDSKKSQKKDAEEKKDDSAGVAPK